MQITATPAGAALTPAQADGLACVVCGEDYTEFLGDTVPVGVSATGSQVFACKHRCADLAAALRSSACTPPALALWWAARS